VIEARAALQRGIEAIDGLRVLGDPRLSLLAFSAEGFDAWDVHARMLARGWQTLRLGRPRAIAINVGPADMPFVRGYLADLPRAVAAARKAVARRASPRPRPRRRMESGLRMHAAGDG
jgi:hypothetical protein